MRYYYVINGMVKIKRQTIPSVDDNVERLSYIAIGNLGKQLISIIYVNTHYIIQYFHSCEIRVITTYVQKTFAWKVLGTSMLYLL